MRTCPYRHVKASASRWPWTIQAAGVGVGEAGGAQAQGELVGVQDEQALRGEARGDQDLGGVDGDDQRGAGAQDAGALIGLDCEKARRLMKIELDQEDRIRDPRPTQ